jgi:hypothetical protein
MVHALSFCTVPFAELGRNGTGSRENFAGRQLQILAATSIELHGRAEERLIAF